MKKIVSILLVLLLVLSCTCALASRPIVDDANLFTADQESELRELIAEFQKSTGMDFAIYTSITPHSSSIAEVADAFYDNGGYGLDDENSGMVYFIDMAERTPYIGTTGKMIDYMTDERIEKAHDAAYSNLRIGAYSAAAKSVLQSVERFVKSGIPEGQYRYDVLTGQMLTPRHKALTPMELLMCAGIALVAALIFSGSVKGSYLLKHATYQYDHTSNSDMDILDREDQYLRTTVTRTRKATPPPTSGSHGGGGSSRPSGGSGVHRSSGGVRHGGGAGKKF